MVLDIRYNADITAEGSEQERWDTRFQVKCSNSIFNDANKYDRYFTIKSHADEYVEKMRNKYPCIWLLERGYYRKKTWINIWWSSTVVREWGDPPDRGWGRPIDMRSSVRYQPEPPVLSPNLDDLE